MDWTMAWIRPSTADALPARFGAVDVPTSPHNRRRSRPCRIRHESTSLLFDIRLVDLERMHMAQEPLRTYLRTFRRRTCLSQDEVAFLLGSMCGTSVSRHERGRRVPMLETLIGYMIIFDVDAAQLYEGVHQDVYRRIVKRARGLLASLEGGERTAVTERKIAVLRRLLVDGGLANQGGE